MVVQNLGSTWVWPLFRILYCHEGCVWLWSAGTSRVTLFFGLLRWAPWDLLQICIWWILSRLATPFPVSRIWSHALGCFWEAKGQYLWLRWDNTCKWGLLSPPHMKPGAGFTFRWVLGCFSGSSLLSLSDWEVKARARLGAYFTLHCGSSSVTSHWGC